MPKVLNGILYSCILVGPLFGGCYPNVDSKTQDIWTDFDGDTDYEDTDTGTDADTDDDFDDDDDECEGSVITYQCELRDVVTSEPPGTAAQQDAICNALSVPVQSNTAARVTLDMDAASNNFATGHIEIAPDLVDHMLGLPTIEVTFANPDELAQMNISKPQPATGGFNFEVSWNDLPYYYSIQFLVTSEVKCEVLDGGTPDDGGAADTGDYTRLVRSLTNIELCFTSENYQYSECSIQNWVSSGDYCYYNEVVGATDWC